MSTSFGGLGVVGTLDQDTAAHRHAGRSPSAITSGFDSDAELVVRRCSRDGERVATSPTRVAEEAPDEELAGLRAQTVEVMAVHDDGERCLLYTSPSPRDGLLSRMPS